MSLLSLLSYLVLGYLIFGVIRNKITGHQEALNQENKTCMENTINCACDIGRSFEDTFQRACSLNDFAFTAKVFKFIINIYK
jgi:hypothetical protein